MTTRIYGARLEPLIAPVRDLVLSAGAGATPAAYDLSRFVDGIRDQLGQRCVGEALAAGFHVAVEGRGKRGSAHGLWTMARVRERARRGVELLDVGTIPEDAIGAAVEDGIYPEDPVEESDPEAIKRELFWDELRAAAPVDDNCVLAVDPIGHEAGIDFALSQGAPSFFCMPVDDQYERYDGSDIYPGILGQVLGYHAQLVVGSDALSFLVANSWGKGFGRGGYSRIARSFFAGPLVSNVYAIMGGPIL